ncbi:hypothetical protein ACFQ9X_29265 [Catenulispora yoronensis]
MRDQLVAGSGVERLRGLIQGHFGHRAALIKLDKGVQQAWAEIARVRLARQQGGGPAEAGPALDIVADRLQRLRQRGHGFAELATLTAHYRGRLDFTDEQIDQLLQVTGEHGTTCAARVGLPEDAPAGAIRARADDLVKVWAALAADRTLAAREQQAVRTVLGCYQRIQARARRAELLLNTTDELALDDE